MNTIVVIRVLNQITDDDELFKWASNLLLINTANAESNRAFSLFGLNSLFYKDRSEMNVAQVVTAALLYNAKFATLVLHEMSRFASCGSSIRVPDRSYRGLIVGLLQAVSMWADIQPCVCCGKERRTVEYSAAPILVYLLQERDTLPVFDHPTSGVLSNVVARVVSENTVFLRRFFALLSERAPCLDEKL